MEKEAKLQTIGFFNLLALLAVFWGMWAYSEGAKDRKTLNQYRVEVTYLKASPGDAIMNIGSSLSPELQWIGPLVSLAGLALLWSGLHYAIDHLDYDHSWGGRRFLRRHGRRTPG